MDEKIRILKNVNQFAVFRGPSREAPRAVPARANHSDAERVLIWSSFVGIGEHISGSSKLDR